VRFFRVVLQGLSLGVKFDAVDDSSSSTFGASGSVYFDSRSLKSVEKQRADLLLLGEESTILPLRQTEKRERGTCHRSSKGNVIQGKL
jgi:hypothetical protein